MGNFKYKYNGVTWTVYVNKPRKGSGYHWTWDAQSSWGSLADREGGELGDMANAKATIKSWIRRFMDSPYQFRAMEPYLHARRY